MQLGVGVTRRPAVNNESQYRVAPLIVREFSHFIRTKVKYYERFFTIIASKQESIKIENQYQIF